MATPREVMFDVMGDQWNISNKDLASMILSDKAVTKGKSPLELAQVRSSLSRYVVHVQPGEYCYRWLAPFEVSIPKVVSACKHAETCSSNREIVEYLGGEGCRLMKTSLDEHGLDGALYANTAARIAAGDIKSDADAAELSVMLFVITGCLGDPAKAVETTMVTAKRYSGPAVLETALPVTNEAVTLPGEVYELGMYRFENGVLLSNAYRLNTSPDGTEIGSMSTTPHSINDVGRGVSRRHARIWRDEAGQWWVEGLGSTNGTTLVSGIDRSTTVVEPPKAKAAGFESRPVPIFPGDSLNLAGTTEFVFVSLPKQS